MQESVPYFDTEEFKQFFGQQLGVIDQILAGEEIPVHSRSMHASMFFVDHCLVCEKTNEPPPNYLEQQWFGQIASLAIDWYQKQFGSALLQTPESTINAVVLLFGTPFPLNIPMLPSVPGKEPWIKQLHFARDVLDHENPVEWIVPRPDVCAISDEKRIHVLTQVTEICNLNRRAYWELAFLTAKTDQIQKLHASIDGHLESGASGICNKHFGNAIWDLHLALEKVLKIFLAQHGCSDFPHTHNNFKLIELSCKRGLTPLDGIRFDLMPSSEDAIKHRYGEIEAPSLTEIFEVYKVTLAAIGHVATELDHHEFGRRDHVYIRALPWAPIRKKHDLSLRIEG